MTESIRRQLVVPPYVSAIHMAVGLGMVAAGIVLLAASSSGPVALEPEVELAVPPVSVEAPREAAAASEVAAPAADEIQLVFRADGASYMRLADLPRDEEGAVPGPRHGAPRLVVEEDGTVVAIAAVGDADVPAIHRAWAGKQVVVDGDCRATVTGFAVVSRLIGDPVYAGIEKPRWDVASVMYAGARVLAARLDRCDGLFARDVALAPIVIPEPIQDERLAGAARSALIASPAGLEAKRSWDDFKPSDVEGAWWEHAGIDADVLRHPQTGETLVTVHAALDREDCGGPDINVWGVYRVAADGTLSPVHEVRLDPLHSIQRVIDIEGDGELELIGRSWLGDDVVLAREDGSERDRLDVPFHGCPC